MSILQNILNWLCDDSNLIKVLLVALAVLLILILFRKVTIQEIRLRSPKNLSSPKRLHSNWEPERPNDLTNSFDNPWDVMNGQEGSMQKEKTPREKAVKALIWICILAAIAIVIFIIVKKFC